MRRRRAALGAIAGLAVIAGLIAGANSGEEPANTAGVPGAAAPPPSCPGEVVADLDRLVGQRLVVRMEDSPTADLLERARRGELGGVVLFPSEGASEEALGHGIARLREAARAGGFPEPLVAIDQEGGEVKRLADAPPEIAPSEIESAGGGPLAREQGRKTGEALARLGIDVDLAPVLDVPTIAGSFISARAFSDEESVAGQLGSEFAVGLGEAGVAATAKHFPGLGSAVANTDLEPSAVDPPARDLERALEPFKLAIGAEIPLVMVANATYPAYDDVPASLSRTISTGLLRRELAFAGAVITDDLGAGALTGGGYDEGEAAIAATGAGADLLLFALGDGRAAAAALVRAVKLGELAERDLVASCARVAALRGSLNRTARSPTRVPDSP